MQKTTSPKLDLYTRVTDKILADLAQGVRPWLKPWNADNTVGRISHPLRANGTPYRGINVLLLWGATLENGYQNPTWLTFKQADALRAHVRKGEKGSLVVYAGTFRKTETNEATGEETEKDVPFLKPVRIRFRMLDPALPSLPGCPGLADITLDAASFAVLSLPVTQVFITENEINLLAFPLVSKAIVIFGAGYGWEALANAAWLNCCEVHYWGDFDTHGFAILDRLRGYFPEVRSLLMDREALLAHRGQWGKEPEPVRHDLIRLTSDEAALYDDLRFDRIRAALRLEQERISYGWLGERLARGARES